jgi:dolichol kinase
MDLFPLDEVKRKTFHFLTLIYILAYWVLPKPMVLWGLGIAIIIVLIGELIRLRSPGFNERLLKILGGVHRKEEENRMSGLAWTLSGSFLTILLFNNNKIVVLSFLYLAFGDAFAALVGKRFGKHKILFNKSLEGSAACFVVCFIVGICLVSWPVALAGALLATIIELIPWPLNDNFWMPLVSSTALTVLVPLIRSIIR